MKSKFISSLCFLFLALFLPEQLKAQAAESYGDAIFPVKKNNLVGYMNPEGKWIIEAKYQVGKEFTEGCAAVREKGLYGYINTKDEYIIPPIYDFAFPFINGLAKVFIGSKPYYINRNNEIVFEHNYRQIIYNVDADAFVVQDSAKWTFGVVDRKNQVVVDLIYSSLKKIEKDFYLIKYRGTENHIKSGIISRTGKVIVPAGQYASIEGKGEGWVNAYTYTGSKRSDNHLINLYDTSRTIVLNSGLSTGDFSDGYAILKHAPHERQMNKNILLLHESGRIDTLKNAEKIYPFKNGLTFVWFEKSGYKLINKNLEVLAGPFESFLYTHNDGIALVKEGGVWKILDSNYVLSEFPVLSGKEYCSREGNIITMTNSDKEKLRYNLKTKAFYPKEEQGLFLGFPYWHNKSMMTFSRKDENNEPYEHGLINENGEIVFVEKVGKYTGELNIDYQRYQYPISLVKKERLKRKERKQYEKEIFVTLLIGSDSIKGLEEGKPYARVVNNSGKTFKSEYSPLKNFFTLMVQNKEGFFVSITGETPAICGYPSYINPIDEFKPGKCYYYALPDFKGTYKTRMRIMFDYSDNLEMRHFKLIHGENEIPCQVNPGQLWRDPVLYEGPLFGGYW